MAYTTATQVRALTKLDDAAVYTNAMITEGILWAKTVIDNYTGTSFENTTHTLTLDGSGGSRIFTDVPHLTSVTSCTIDDVAVADVSGWVVKPGGIVERDSGIFTYTAPGQNVTLVVVANASPSGVPTDISWAAKTLARWYVLRLASEMPDNTIFDNGIVKAQAGGKHGPTSLPEVNAVLKRHLSRPPRVA